MPIISSINLTEKAYDIYREIKKGKRSATISAALMQYHALSVESAIVSKRYREGDIR